MQLNLTSYLSDAGRSDQLQVVYEKQDLMLGDTSYPVRGQESMKLTVSNTGKNEVSVKAQGQIEIETSCDRCLKPVIVKLIIDREEVITEKDIMDPQPGDQISFLDGYELDTDVLIEDTCISEMPPKVLCKEDCKGLCLVCGADLNEGDCGCDRFVPDPRMAAFGEVFAAANAKKDK